MKLRVVTLTRTMRFKRSKEEKERTLSSKGQLSWRKEGGLVARRRTEVVP